MKASIQSIGHNLPSNWEDQGRLIGAETGQHVRGGQCGVDEEDSEAEGTSLGSEGNITPGKLGKSCNAFPIEISIQPDALDEPHEG